MLADVAKKTDAQQAEQTIQMTSQANPAVDEAEQANTAEAWYHRTASEVGRGEAPMINEAGIFTANYNDAIETTSEQAEIAVDQRAAEGEVLKTLIAGADVSPKANENTTTIADVPTVLRA